VTPFDQPYQAPDYDTEDLRITKTVKLDDPSSETIRQNVLDYFHKSFSLYESLFECLRGDEAYYARANPLRHPLIFYYGHTSVFFINKLNVAKMIDERVDPKIESMLAIGVDEMSWDDLNEAHYDWPTPAEVKAHRDATREIVDRFIRTCEVKSPVTWDDPLWIVMMGIEHERIHLETSSVLMRELPLDMLKPHPFWGRICKETGAAPQNELLPISGKTVTLGKGENNTFYGWDNEYGFHDEKVTDFKASKYLVSNGEFLEFIKAGGYQNQDYWNDEGWNWVQYRNAEHPVFWIKDGDEYQYRTMLEIIPMPWDWPADINYLEAKAFCEWKSETTGKHIRMPTEAEWYALRDLEETDQPDWNKAPGNINLEYEISSCPVNRHEFASGFFDIIGNVWQWTETPIDGYDGFRVHEIYDDFSTPTFDGKHNIFKGGCWISTGNYALKDSRYAFRRHFFQHAGLRYIEAHPLEETDMNIYETDRMVSEYIEFHYGEEKFGVPNFPLSCINAIREVYDGAKTRALDLGCATGRSSFELAKDFEHVDAIDFSVRLIEAPTNLQKRGSQRYVIHDEGDLVTYKETKLEDFDGYEAVKDRINFMQGDACNLTDKYTDYNLVFAGNLIDRLYDPAKFLNLIKERINEGGMLILTSPYTWLEEFTPRDKWLGGFKADTGESYTTLEGIADTLAPEFEMISEPRDIPFVIRETARKHQHTISQMSFWKKRTT
jgi:5-histidylcysteine sulfoxide synthase/putative 4-mercaptohistidine N1-methyltranferase